MNREKQIDIIEDLLIEDLLIDFDEMGFAPTTACPDPEAYAKEWKDKLISAFEGYRKQSVVVDEFTKRLKEVPIKCGLPLLGLSTKNEIEEYFNDIMMQVSDAIDNVAKGMKGGEGE